ncbi:cryptochrome/photolyase family protein, partial [Streptomyces acidiscabies]|uniref:cryptochrome/photolyase family protein n=1 Tax=Streptomyces acidiscabies TaxID=42234 RepID=UPI0038F5E008
LFLSAMRHYAEAHGDVEYRRLDPASKPIALAAAEYAASLGHRELWAYEPHDAFFKAELEEASQVYGLELRLVPSPGFLTSTEAWRGYRS